jgi:hypothetical protein
MTDSEPAPGTGRESDRRRHAPTVNNDGTITLWGVGPTCPGCNGPTHAVTDSEAAARPWWCAECRLRLDDAGEPGSQAQLPADHERTCR